MDNSPKTLLFATSGIRGKANLFINPELAIRVGKAVCVWIHDKYPDYNDKLVYIGFDNRRNSKAIASCLAAAINSSGINVIQFVQAVPTPLVIHATINKKAQAGLMVTGSHLPAEDNGIILFDGEGNYYKGVLPEKIDEPVSWSRLGKQFQSTTEIEAYKIFLEEISKQLKLIKTDYKILIDPVHGPMKDYLEEILRPLVSEIIKINWEDDDRFPGRNSEPLPANLENTRKKLLENECDLGITTDMDGDRVIFITKTGKIITGDYMGAILSEIIWDTFPDTPIIVPINTSSIINIVANKLQHHFKYCKVGPPNIIEAIHANNSKFGFEETGKYIFTDFAMWPDSAITTLILFSLLQEKNSTLDNIFNELPALTSIKTKIPFLRENAPMLMKMIPEVIKSYIDNVKNINELDGLRINFEDHAWLLLRPSGTEDFIRIFAEHRDPKKAENLSKIGEKIIHDIIKNTIQ